MTVKYKVEIVDIASKDIHQIYQYFKKMIVTKMLDMYVISLERLLKNLRYFPKVVLILMNFMSGMSILFHTTKLKGNCL